MKWVKELASVPHKLENVLEKTWPGSTAVILPKKKIIPPIITASENTVAIRLSDYILVDKLLGKFGYPLTATSANMTDDINKIIESFRQNIWKPDLILDAGVLPPSPPATILDFSNIKPKILRIGPSKPEQLMKLLRL